MAGAQDNTGSGLSANAGTVILNKTSGPNVHAIGSGGLTVAGGRVSLSGTGGDQILDSAPVTINSGTFDLNGNSETIGALSGSGGAITNGSFIVPSTLTVSGSGTYAGFIQNGGFATALTIANGGNLTLTNANSYTGGTTISGGGTLRLGDGATSNGTIIGNVANNGSLVIANPNYQSFGYAVNGSGSLTKSGAGELVLTTTSNFTGSTTVNGGILLLLGGSLYTQGPLVVSSAIPGQSALLFVDGTTTFSQSGAAVSTTVGALTGGMGGIVIGTTNNGATLSTGSGDLTINPTGSLNIGYNAVTGTLNAGGNVNVNGGSFQIVNSGSQFNLASGRSMTVQTAVLRRRARR